MPPVSAGSPVASAPAGSERMSGGEDLQQRVLDDDGQAERDQQRGQLAAAQAAGQHGPLQQVADSAASPAAPATSGTSGSPRRAVPSDRARKAPSTVRSPCARLTIRITPKTSDRPQANRAYTPPSSMPCTTALTRSRPARACRSRRRDHVRGDVGPGGRSVSTIRPPAGTAPGRPAASAGPRPARPASMAMPDARDARPARVELLDDHRGQARARPRRAAARRGLAISARADRHGLLLAAGQRPAGGRAARRCSGNTS